MFCQKCGKELNENNVCENCYPSHINTFNEIFNNRTTNSTKTNTKKSTSNPSNPKVTFNDIFEKAASEKVISDDDIVRPKKKVKSNVKPNTKSNNKPNDEPNENELRDVNNISSKEFLSFIGDKNSDYFTKKWTKSQRNKNFLSLNISALFTNFFWFWYRKMYGTAIVIFFLTAILSALMACLAIIIVAPIVSDFSPYITEHKWVTLIICLFVPLIISLNADQLYIKYVIKKINKIKSKKSPALDNDALLKRLQLTGGTTMAPLFVIIVILLILLIYILIVIEPSIFIKFINYVLKFVRKIF